MTFCAIRPLLIEQAGRAFCDAHPALIELAGPARIQRAFEIAGRCTDIEQISPNEFLIQAHEQDGLYYYLNRQRQTCSCSDFHTTQLQNGTGLGLCAHAFAVRFWLDGQSAFTQFQHAYDAAFACLDHPADDSDALAKMQARLEVANATAAEVRP